MTNDSRIDNGQEAGKGTLASYVTGFILSLLLTVIAYVFVTSHGLTTQVLVFVIAGLGITQLLIQLVFFLHLDRESKPRWNLVAFLFLLLVIGILVFGSLWIMHNLDYNQARMSPADTNTYIIKDEGIQP